MVALLDGLGHWSDAEKVMEDPIEFAGRRLQSLSTRGGGSIQDEGRKAE